jgi:hypothetical protein
MDPSDADLLKDRMKAEGRGGAFNKGTGGSDDSSAAGGDDAVDDDDDDDDDVDDDKEDESCFDFIVLGSNMPSSSLVLSGEESTRWLPFALLLHELHKHPPPTGQVMRKL